MTIPAGFAQVSVEYTGNGAPSGAANVFGVDPDPTLTPGNVADFVRDAWIARVMPMCTDDVTLSKVRVKFGPDDTGPFAEVSASTPGGSVSASLTPNTAYLINKNTAIGGRRGRGRMFIPGVPEQDANDAGDLVSGRITQLNAALASLRTDLSTGLMPMVLLHSPATIWILDSNGQPRRQNLPAAPPSPDLVTSLTCASRVATQRRRLRR